MTSGHGWRHKIVDSWRTNLRAVRSVRRRGGGNGHSGSCSILVLSSDARQYALSSTRSGGCVNPSSRDARISSCPKRLAKRSVVFMVASVRIHRRSCRAVRHHQRRRGEHHDQTAVKRRWDHVGKELLSGQHICVDSSRCSARGSQRLGDRVVAEGADRRQSRQIMDDAGSHARPGLLGQCEAAGDDVGGHRGDGTFARVGVSP